MTNRERLSAMGSSVSEGAERSAQLFLLGSGRPLFDVNRLGYSVVWLRTWSATRCRPVRGAAAGARSERIGSAPRSGRFYLE